MISSGQTLALTNKKGRFLRFVGERERIKSILVIRNGLLGDVVSITPVLQRLHSTFGGAAIDVVVSEKSITLLDGFPGIRNVFSLSAKFSLLKHIRLFLHLRRYRYDIIAVEEANSHYTIMARLAGAKYFCGMDNSLGKLLDLPVPRSPGLHTVEAQIETVLEWTDSSANHGTLLAVKEEEKKSAKEYLHHLKISDNDYLVCLHPGCSAPNSVRQWLPVRYSELADNLVEKYNAKIIFTGVQQDQREVESIRAGMRHSSVSLVGLTSLRQLISFLDRADLVVGPDTGTLHIACALQTPVVMLMGFADPLETGPYDPRKISRYVRVDLPCIGCATRAPKPQQWEWCKENRPVLCMETLLVERVLKAVEETRAAASKQFTNNVVFQ
jgi:ADP-heptose:LPS heptosyltransferase